MKMAQYDIDIRDYWRIIKKRKPIIIFSMITMLIFSFIFANYKRSRVIDIYSSSATIRIDTDRAYKSYLTSYGYSSSNDISEAVKSITTFPVMAEVALRVGMLPDSLKALPDSVRNEIIQSDPFLLKEVNSLSGIVAPEQFEYTNFIVVRTVDYDPVVARDMAQHVVNAYKTVRRKNANQQIINSINYIKENIVSIESQMDSVKKEIEKFTLRHDSLLPYYSESTLSSEMVNVNRRQDDVEFRRLSTETMINLLEKDGMVDDSVLSNAFAEEEGGIFRDQYQELQDKYEQRDELLDYLTEEHPDIKAIAAKIENQKKMLLNQLKSNLTALERQKDNYDVRLDSLRDRYEDVNKKNESVMRFEDRYNILENQYLEFTRRLQDLHIESAQNIDEVTIIEPAVINPIPVNPATPILTISFIGLFLGTIIGLTAAFIFEALDTSIGTIEDVEAFLDVPVIGLIPQIGLETLKSNLYTSEGEKKHEYDISDDHAMLVIHYAPKSVLAESYRSLRTNIQFISYEQEAKVLLFTSTSAREGKTTSIVNLSLTMAQSGNRVLLVDADLRRPSIDILFGLERERGLSEIVLGKRHWKECVKTVADIITGSLGMSDIILEPGIDNLHIITCGTIPPNPSELLNSENMDEFIKAVGKEYDIVLFDCSPTLPATDSAVLGRKTDGVVFVYAVGKVSRGSLKRAKSQMDNVKARVIGVVLNGIRADLSIDFHDYKYKEYYYAYTEEKFEMENSKVGKIKKFVSDFIGRFG